MSSCRCLCKVMLWLLILGVAADYIKADKEYSLDPGSSMLLDLPSLKPSASYEVRVSFLGTVGADVQIRWACPSAEFDEKLHLRTEAKQLYGPPCDTRSIEVRAIRNSRGATEALDKAPINFFVTLEGKWSGVPESVLGAAGLLGLLLAVTLCWMRHFKLD